MKYFKDLIKEITYDEIYNYYITENHSVEECNEHFKLAGPMFMRLTKYYGIKKPKALHTANIKKVKKERYGSENYNNAEKRANTNLQKYGVVNQFQREDMMTEVRQKNLEKYGSTNNIYKNLQTRAANSGSVEESHKAQIIKTRKTVLEKYGVDWAGQSEIVKNTIRESLKETFQERYNCDNYWVSEDAKRSNGSRNSHANNNFEQLLISNNISYEKEFLIENRYYDFKVDNFLIEINPTATHNANWSPWKAEGLPKHYHADKTDLATQNGYRCIHIWDWDDQNKIINTFLKKKEITYARNCEVRLVEPVEERLFLEANHFQGYTKSKVALGLYENDSLVLLMTFGVPRYSRKYQWELIRLCSSKQVVGGAAKVFNYFINNYQPQTIVSYCDLSKFEGNVYVNLNFKKISRTISRHWYNLKLKDHITDKLLFKYGFDNLLGKTFGYFGKDSSNEQLMLAHGFVEIYDCGQATYVWKNIV